MNRIIKSIILIISLFLLTITVTYAWIIADLTVSKDMIIQNGTVNALNFSLYRGYDYDLNGYLDQKNSTGTELEMYYNDITNSSDDTVSSIVESSIITYRVVIVNSSNDNYLLDSYFIFDNAIDDNNLYNQNKSILFHLHQIRTIHHVETNPVTIPSFTNISGYNSLMFYTQREFFMRNIEVSAHETLYFDFTLEAANLTDIQQDLISYQTYSTSRYYDLFDGLFINNNNQYISAGSIIDDANNEILLDADGKTAQSTLVNLKNYHQTSNQDLYTSEYLKYENVYNAKQTNTTQNALVFTLSKICFDVKLISGNEQTILQNFSSVDLSLYKYIVNEEEVTSYYDNTGNEITGTDLAAYNLVNGIYDVNGNKIKEIFNSAGTFKYTLYYEENTVAKISVNAVIN